MAIRPTAEALSCKMAPVVFYCLQKCYLDKCHTFLHDFSYLMTFKDLEVCCANFAVTSQVCVCIIISLLVTEK